MDGLKDGIILCEFISKLQPVSVKKINESAQNWYQLENLGNFIKAIAKYRGKPHSIFEANDLFENIDHAQVQSALLALASMAKKKGNKVNVGVKYVEKRSRNLSQRSFEKGRTTLGCRRFLPSRTLGPMALGFNCMTLSWAQISPWNRPPSACRWAPARDPARLA